MSSPVAELNKHIENVNLIANLAASKDEIIRRLEELSEKLTQERLEISKTQDQFQEQKGKDETFINGFDRVIKDERARLNGIEEAVKSYKNKAREALVTMKPQDLAKLPVEKSEALNKLFKFLFKVLYPNNPEEYEWRKFKSIALKKQKEDFQARMVNFDLKKLTPELAKELNELKDLPNHESFQNDSLIDLLTWCDFIYEDFLKTQQKQEEIDRIESLRKDFSERKVQAAYIKMVLPHKTKLFNDLDNYKNKTDQLMKVAKRIKVDTANVNSWVIQCRRAVKSLE